MISFIERVLELAKNPEIPLFERLKFLSITCSDLDEFFEVRVAGTKHKITHHAHLLTMDGYTPQENFRRISIKAHALTQEIYHTYKNELLPRLAREKVHILLPEHWPHVVQKWVSDYFDKEVYPLVSPIALDFLHPFPRLVNKSLNFIVSLSGKDAFGRDLDYAIVHAPRLLPRVIPLPKSLGLEGDNFIHLSCVIQEHVHKLFPGMTISGCYPFRLTRNSHLYLDEEDVEDVVRALEEELHARDFGKAVRLEIDAQCPSKLINFLLKKHGLTQDDMYLCDGPVNLHRYVGVVENLTRPDLCYEPFQPVKPKVLQSEKLIFDALDKQDILLHHPYDDFQSIVELIHQAANDPRVAAIKQTIYRSHASSAMVNQLAEAARSGKEVTAVIELRARFDEESNLKLAQKLHDAGALVLYGIVGVKTHAKMTLIVRRCIDGKLKPYAHLGTGNYHESTAKLYTDLGLLTANPEICEDVSMLFHQLTGLGKVLNLKRLKHSPFTLQPFLEKMINRATAAAKAGTPAKLIFKTNGLTDKRTIKSLYQASQAGVEITLFIRALCTMRPGIPGLSENIKIISIVGRFLEHHRVYYANINGKEELYASSADLMERNLYGRVEALFPILDPNCFKRIKEDIIDNYLADDQDAWIMNSDGSYTKAQGHTHSAQETLLKKYCHPQN